MGRIFCPNGEHEWMNSHVCPLAVIEKTNCIRVYFSARTKMDENGNYVSYPTYIDLDKSNPKKILYIHDKPILELGRAGAFDEFGIMVLKPLIVEEKVYLYYAGWQRLASKTSPYQINVGLAISEDGGDTFTKVSEGPILGMDYVDPIGVGNVYPVYVNGQYHLYYTSILHWESSEVKPTILYNIKHAVSDDGIYWVKDGKVIIEADEKGGVVAPTIFEHDGKNIMLFGYRQAFEEDGTTGRYKMGYAETKDWLHWERNDSEAGIEASDEGWDSEMVCYPHVVKIGGKTLLFYCGNGFGRDGFGYAVLEE